MTQDQALFDANLAFFSEHYPEVAKIVRGARPLTQLGERPEGKPNIKSRKGDWLYGGGAEEYSRLRVAHYLDKTRQIWVVPSKDTESHVKQFVNKSLDRMEEGIEGIALSKQPQEVMAYTLCVFGVGLGYQFPLLLKGTPCKHLVIIEQSPDYIYHSCFITDWQGIDDTMQSRGGRIEFVFEISEEDMFLTLRNRFWLHNLVAIDGVMCYFDQPTDSYHRLWQRMQSEFSTMVAGVGFYEDELNHLRNTVTNLLEPDSTVLRRESDPIDLPLFVIGAGPSLDDAMETIRENADNAVLLACGTAVEPLLRAGITPDVVVLLERGKDLIEIYDTMSKKVALDTVPLLASTTCYPGLDKFFKGRINFFRPGLNPVSVFPRGKEEILHHCDPTVTNTGVAFGRHLGFEEIYLFGVDFGAADPHNHHAKGTVYTRDTEEESLFYEHPEYNIPCPGNFGEMVYSSSILFWSKFALEKVNPGRHYKKYYNCSHGTQITGFAPRHHSTLQLQPTATKAKGLERFHKNGTAYGPTESRDRLIKADYKQQAADLVEAMNDALPDAEALLNKEHVAKVMKTLWNMDGGATPVVMQMRGTLTTKLVYMDWLLNRLERKEQRQTAAAIFLEEYKVNLRSMQEELCAMIDELLALAEEKAPQDDAVPQEEAA